MAPAIKESDNIINTCIRLTVRFNGKFEFMCSPNYCIFHFEFNSVYSCLKYWLNLFFLISLNRIVFINILNKLQNIGFCFKTLTGLNFIHYVLKRISFHEGNSFWKRMEFLFLCFLWHFIMIKIKIGYQRVSETSIGWKDLVFFYLEHSHSS